MHNVIISICFFLVMEWSFLVMHSSMLPFFFVFLFLIIIFFLSNKYMDMVISFFWDSFEVLLNNSALRYLFNWQLFFFLKRLLITVTGFLFSWTRILSAVNYFFLDSIVYTNLFINNFNYLYINFFKFVI